MVALHVVGVVVAALAGAVVLARPKGTRQHRAWGLAYSVGIVTTSLSSFGIHELRDGPSVFHGIAVLTLAVLAAGLAQSRWRRSRPSWWRWHAALMQASYLMLVITGVAQFFDELPLPNEALNAIVFLQLPLIAGFVLIGRSVRHGSPVPAAEGRRPA